MRTFVKSTDGREKRETWFGSFFRFMCVSIGVVGGVVTCWQWFRESNSNPLIDVRVIDKQCLTRSFDEPGLICDYTFRGRKVHDLWAMKIKLENVCNKNVIGISGGDLMSTDLVFCVSSPLRIIAYELENNQIDGGISTCSNQMHLGFTKWYPGTGCVVRLFCEGADQIRSPTQIHLGTCGDPLKQGDVRITDQNETQEIVSPSRNLLGRLPRYVRVTLEWLVIILHGLVLVVVICVLGKIPWIKIHRRRKWEKRYGAAFETAIARELSDEASCDYKKGLDNVPDDFWEKTNIPKPCLGIDFYDGNGINRNSLVPFIIIMCVMGIAAATVLSALVNV